MADNEGLQFEIAGAEDSEPASPVQLASAWQRSVVASKAASQAYSFRRCETALPQGVISGLHPSASRLLLQEARRGSWSSSASFHSYGSVPIRGAKAGNVLTRSSSSMQCADFEEPQSDDMPQMTLNHSGSDLSTDSWNNEMHLVRRNAVFRLQARLGKRSIKGNVTATQIHNAVTSLGLVKLSYADIENWLCAVATAFAQLEVSTRKSSNSLRRSFPTLRLFPSASLLSDDSPVSAPSRGPRSIGMRFKAFVEVLLNDEILGTLDEDVQQIALTVREVLFSGDANRLVAELTNVRVDDVAAPLEKPDFMTFMEPMVAFMIFLNGIVIGLETGFSNPDNQNVWFWVNASFTIFFVVEILTRAFKSGLLAFVNGRDRFWNWFDSLLILISVVDITLEAMTPRAAEVSAKVAPLTVIRILRLTRLTRLIRIFRLRYMKELSLMVKGLLGGLYTLFWAVVLLFFTLYVIAILATSTIGRSQETAEEVITDGLFSSVPNAVFTSFRCFLGDCTTSQGKPIVKLLSDTHGILFVMCYFGAMIFVVFGLFNLIVAIYIENTMNAAKTDGEKTKGQRQRESVRIARLTRQLLKKFCAAQRLWAQTLNGVEGDAPRQEVKKMMKMAVFDDVQESDIPVTKEMFLCIIQDTSVQKLLDDLDIPPDRANLFDILDADGSGGLEVSELITGLLRVRGEAKKSDIVGTLLAVRNLQHMVREQGVAIAELFKRLEKAPSGGLTSSPGGKHAVVAKLAEPRAKLTRSCTAATLRERERRYRSQTMVFSDNDDDDDPHTA